ncbi:MAG: hypothetical protein U0491_00920 [Candidatus Saccharimonadales bacterium]
MEPIKNLIYVATGVLGDPNSLGIPKSPTTSDAKLQSILYFVFGLIAAISFLVIVIAGFKYVISIGDPQKIVSARKTIVYAVIGLIISLSATAIVAFVIGKV